MRSWVATPWRLVDARVPRSRPARRLRALVLAGMATIAVSGLVSAASEPPTGPASATGPAPTTTTTTRPPSTIQPLVAPPGLAPVVTRVPTTDPVVFLTIDDGNTRSPDVARTLAELDIPTTLFLVDGPIGQGAGFFRALPRAVVEGHTQTHADLRGLPEDRQRAEICGNADTAQRAFGRRPALFRPPYGHYDQATQRAAAACGMAAIVLWEETVDGSRMSFREVPELQPGDIVLLHFRPQLAAELRIVTERIQAAGLRIALLEDYLVAPDAGRRSLRRTSLSPRGTRSPRAAR
jgi:peptidoglycan/xylan/chitin deacetylase (PgdA/CDA1 family)